jgi:radical SAM superfamily enzyme YgiQ (UPF0313 family)
MVPRAANDLGYMAAVLRKMGLEPLIRDYMGEGKTEADFVGDLRKFNPDLIVCSITSASLPEDIATFKTAKEHNPDIITVAKGAYFFTSKIPDSEMALFQPMDYGLVGEAEVVIGSLIAAINAGQDIALLKGIVWRRGASLISNGPADFLEDLDTLPFPERSLMNNSLYTRPDTGEMQATIQVSRGCPFECTFCLAPLISGKKIRARSVDNILAEIENCVHQYGIKNFFFRSDTFTTDAVFVEKLCDEIVRRRLDIAWVANSRVTPLSYELLAKMKKAGCWLISFGIESGNEETLTRIHKRTTVEDAVRAVQLAKKAGLKTYGLYILGFPWENERHMEDTLCLAKKLNCDFSEFSICTFYEGTPLYEEAKSQGLLGDPFSSSAGKNYFVRCPGTQYLSGEQVLAFRRKALRAIYLSPAYIIRTLLGLRSLGEFTRYFYFGGKLLRNLLKKSDRDKRHTFFSPPP